MFLSNNPSLTGCESYWTFTSRSNGTSWNSFLNIFTLFFFLKKKKNKNWDSLVHYVNLLLHTSHPASNQLLSWEKLTTYILNEQPPLLFLWIKSTMVDLERLIFSTLFLCSNTWLLVTYLIKIRFEQVNFQGTALFNGPNQLEPTHSL